jgi:hypothetical protein
LGAGILLLRIDPDEDTAKKYSYSSFASRDKTGRIEVLSRKKRFLFHSARFPQAAYQVSHRIQDRFRAQVDSSRFPARISLRRDQFRAHGIVHPRSEVPVRSHGHISHELPIGRRPYRRGRQSAGRLRWKPRSPFRMTSTWCLKSRRMFAF